MEKLKNYIIKHLRCLQELFNFYYDSILIKDDQSSYLSPEQFKKFVNPFCEEIIQEIGINNNIYKMWHSDGTLFNNIENMISLKINALCFFDPSVDLEIYKNKIGGKICLIGNIHPLKILRESTPENVLNECIRQIKIMKNVGGYVLSPGGEIAAGTPEKNIDVMIESIKIS
jgi:uroporphyrinogen decarboxylase